MTRSFDLISIGGIAIRCHVSALLAFGMLVVLGATVYVPTVLPQQGEQTYWSLAFISALFVFLSITAHELGHSLVARGRGIAVEAITLFMFGGASDIRDTRSSPLDEMFVSVSGPAVSLVVALLAALTRLGVPRLSEPLSLFLESVLLLNLWLGGFNLLPTLPLDGGRAVRGLIWHHTGDFRRATRLATRLSRGMAAAVFAAGALLLVVSLDDHSRPFASILGYDPRFAATAAIVIAWFMNNGARAAYRQVILQSRFQGLSVRQLMTPDPETVTPWTSLDEVVARHFLQRGERAVAVAREGNRLAGLIAYADVRRVPRTEWSSRAVGEVMTPLGDLTTVSPDDGVDIAIRHMAEQHYNQLPVVESGQLVGMIARVNVVRYIDLKDEINDDPR